MSYKLNNRKKSQYVLKCHPDIPFMKTGSNRKCTGLIEHGSYSNMPLLKQLQETSVPNNTPFQSEKGYEIHHFNQSHFWISLTLHQKVRQSSLKYRFHNRFTIALYCPKDLKTLERTSGKEPALKAKEIIPFPLNVCQRAGEIWCF